MIDFDDIGVAYVDDFVTDHLQILAEVQGEIRWDERMRARRTASFGRPYNYSGMVYPEVKIPAVIELVRAKVQSQCGYAPNNCLVNYYEKGQYTMGFHADNTAELVAGTGVAVVSLGATRTMVFRNIEDRSREMRRALRGGSLLSLSRRVHGPNNQLPKVTSWLWADSASRPARNTHLSLSTECSQKHQKSPSSSMANGMPGSSPRQLECG